MAPDDKNNVGDDNQPVKTDWEKEREILIKEKEQLLNEKKKTQGRLQGLEEHLQSIGGLDGIEKLKELQQKSEDDKQKQLLSEGKFDEMLKMSMAQQQAQFEAKLNSVHEEKQQTVEKYNQLQQQIRSLNVNNLVKSTAQQLNLQDTAHFDIALHVLQDCSFDDNNNPVFLDQNANVRYNKQGDKFTIEDYVNEQRKIYRHWEKPSKYGFATGSSGSGSLVNMQQSAADAYSLLKENKK